MATVYLVRHGQASFGAADYDNLSPVGHRQAEVAGAALRARGVRVDLAVSGTMRRQRDTAAGCLRVAGAAVPTRTDPRWNEYDFADLLIHHAGRERLGKADEQPTDVAGFQRALDEALAGWIQAGDDSGAAMTWPAFAGGITAALGELLAETGSGRTAVVFTSGGVIAAACMGLLGFGAPGYIALNRVCVNAGITKIVQGRSGTSLVSFNDHAHVDGEGTALRTNR